MSMTTRMRLRGFDWSDATVRCAELRWVVELTHSRGVKASDSSAVRGRTPQRTPLSAETPSRAPPVAWLSARCIARATSRRESLYYSPMWCFCSLMAATRSCAASAAASFVGSAGASSTCRRHTRTLTPGAAVGGCLVRVPSVARPALCNAGSRPCGSSPRGPPRHARY